MKPRRIVSGQFGKFPAWVGASGWITHLKRTELAVYCVLVIHQDNNGRSMPRLDQISAESGVSLKSLPSITKRLEDDFQIIRKQRGGNRMHYEVVLDPPAYMLERVTYWHPRTRKRRNYRRDKSTGLFISLKTSEENSGNISLDFPLDAKVLDFKQIPKNAEQVIPKTTEHQIPKERCGVARP